MNTTDQSSSSKSLNAQRIIAYAGWEKSSLKQPAGLETYSAYDPHGDIEKALKSLGFREEKRNSEIVYNENLLGKPNIFRVIDKVANIEDAEHVAGMAAMIPTATQPRSIIITNAIKQTLDKICDTDIASPTAHVAGPQVLKHELSREVA